ncbi:hypothetical protein LENED_005692 [Lentinula edodes]|uniref:Uncharacterized protein n=1 Tax=Lentinula edodes TaxID=5353 RepID=A0A1Q3E9Q1_LENED|nr:hypothetical protein LENED_005692 [Lentinula edodes]
MLNPQGTKRCDRLNSVTDSRYYADDQVPPGSEASLLHPGAAGSTAGAGRLERSIIATLRGPERISTSARTTTWSLASTHPRDGNLAPASGSREILARASGRPRDAEAPGRENKQSMPHEAVPPQSLLHPSQIG